MAAMVWLLRYLCLALTWSIRHVTVCSSFASATSRNHTNLCDAGFSKWAQITDVAKTEMQKEFGQIPSVPMKQFSRYSQNVCLHYVCLASSLLFV